MTVKKRINNVVEKINENPLLFHREADIRAMLYEELCKEFPKTYDTMYRFKTTLVHCEYFGGKGRRIDVAVLDKNDVSNINSNALTKKTLTDHVNLSVAIEIKTVQGWYGSENRQILAEKDIEKLCDLKNKNPNIDLYYLYIVRWKTAKRQEEILRLVERLRNKCKQKDINFITNDEDNYFLGKTR